MILAIHFLLGALLLSKIPINWGESFLPLAFLLAFLSHYLLDFLPHWDYKNLIKNIREKRWGKSKSEFLLIFGDILVGIFLTLLFSKNLLFVLGAGFLGILADGISFLHLIYPHRILKFHEDFHQKIQEFQEQKIPLLGRIFCSALTFSIIAFWGLKIIF